MSHNQPENKSSVPAKQRYTRPLVKVYGTLTDITQAVGNTGNLDGGSGSNKRTQV